MNPNELTTEIIAHYMCESDHSLTADSQLKLTFDSFIVYWSALVF